MTNTGRRPAYHWSKLQEALSARGGGEVRTERVERVELDQDEVRKLREDVAQEQQALRREVEARKPDSYGRLALAAAVASDAISRGVPGGNYHWHGGEDPFEWEGQKMDAPELIEHAKRVLTK